MVCKYNDCGWCYAPSHLVTTDKNGACHMPSACPQTFDNTGRNAVEHIYRNRDPLIWPEPNLPPINLYALPSAGNFYKSDTYVRDEGCDSEEHW